MRASGRLRSHGRTWFDVLTTRTPAAVADPIRICVVGAGTRFLSGISYYTHSLTMALAQRHRVSAILMRTLLPTRLYPGKERVGTALTSLSYAPRVDAYEGVDWYWLPSMGRALWMLVREKPDVVVFQWWTGTVLHSYLALGLVARLRGARVVIEFHEVLDTGELAIGAARAYVRGIAPLVVRLGSGFVVHSEHDRVALSGHYALGRRPVAVIPHGPFTQYQDRARQASTLAPAEAPDDPAPLNLLYFGVIRPFKGVEDLLTAFEAIPEDQIHGYRLTVVGETWEGWTRPAKMIEHSRYRDRITFVNRYVPDDAVASYFADADAVVLPYHRSSASGPLHVTMSHGLPVIVTSVGGLIEAAGDYEGAVFVPPRDPVAIRAAIEQVAGSRGRRFADPHSWERTVDRYEALMVDVLEGRGRPAVAAMSSS